MPSTHAVSLDGSTDALTADNSASLGITGDITVEAWINFDTMAEFTVGNQVIASKLINGASNYAWTFYRQELTNDANNYNCLAFVFSSATGGGTLTNGRTTEQTFLSTDTGKWFHVAVAVDVSAATMAFYVNGELHATTYSTQAATSIFDGTAKTAIGASHQGTTSFHDGLIDEVRIWSEIRTAEQIRGNMDNDLITGDNLEAHWKLDDSNDDSSGNANTLTDVGTPTFSTDAAFMDKSIDLEIDGTDSYLSITDALQTGLDITGDLTFECWLNLESAPTSGNYLEVMSKYASGGGYDLIYYNQSGTPNFTFSNNDGAGGTAKVDHTLTTATWTHMAITFDLSAGSFELFIDGSSIGSATGTLKTTMPGTATAFTLGRAAGDPSWDGLMDDVRMWNDIRTDAEIADFYDIEISGKESNLVAYWKLNNNYIDHTGNGNILTPNNTPVFSTSISVTPTYTHVSFPDADGAAGATTVDGMLKNDGDASWDDQRQQTSCSSVDDAATTAVATARTSGTRETRRIVTLFDHTDVADDVTVVASVISIQSTSAGESGDQDAQSYINTYASDPASDTSLAVGDFDITKFGAASASAAAPALCDVPIYIIGGGTPLVVANVYNDFTLNSTGLDQITLNGISKFGFLEGHDAENVAVDSAKVELNCNMAEHASGTATAPKFILYYTIPVEAATANMLLVF